MTRPHIRIKRNADSVIKQRVSILPRCAIVPAYKKLRMATSEEKVLIIEDDKFFAELIAEHCTRISLHPLVALRGEEGIEVAKAEKPQLIVLDILMPEMSGFEVLARLKGDTKTKDIPVIVLSNLGTEEDVRKGFALGAVDYLVKVSHDMREILEKITHHLAKN